MLIILLSDCVIFLQNSSILITVVEEGTDSFPHCLLPAHLPLPSWREGRRDELLRVRTESGVMLILSSQRARQRHCTTGKGREVPAVQVGI